MSPTTHMQVTGGMEGGREWREGEERGDEGGKENVKRGREGVNKE